MATRLIAMSSTSEESYESDGEPQHMRALRGNLLEMEWGPAYKAGMLAARIEAGLIEPAFSHVKSQPNTQLSTELMCVCIKAGMPYLDADKAFLDGMLDEDPLNALEIMRVAYDHGARTADMEELLEICGRYHEDFPDCGRALADILHVRRDVVIADQDDVVAFFARANAQSMMDGHDRDENPAPIYLHALLKVFPTWEFVVEALEGYEDTRQLKLDAVPVMLREAPFDKRPELDTVLAGFPPEDLEAATTVRAAYREFEAEFESTCRAFDRFFGRALPDELIMTVLDRIIDAEPGLVFMRGLA